MVYREFEFTKLISSKNLNKFLKKVTRCTWKCPYCKCQCGGINGHIGGHRCKIHSRVPPLQWYRFTLIKEEVI